MHLEKEVPSVEKTAIINALASDLKKQINKETILFFTGDLIEKGAFNFSDKPNAFFAFEKAFIELFTLQIAESLETHIRKTEEIDSW